MNLSIPSPETELRKWLYPFSGDHFPPMSDYTGHWPPTSDRLPLNTDLSQTLTESAVPGHGDGKDDLSSDGVRQQRRDIRWVAEIPEIPQQFWYGSVYPSLFSFSIVLFFITVMSMRDAAVSETSKRWLLTEARTKLGKVWFHETGVEGQDGFLEISVHNINERRLLVWPFSKFKVPLMVRHTVYGNLNEMWIEKLEEQLWVVFYLCLSTFW